MKTSFQITVLLCLVATGYYLGGIFPLPSFLEMPQRIEAISEPQQINEQEEVITQAPTETPAEVATQAAAAEKEDTSITLHIEEEQISEDLPPAAATQYKSVNAPYVYYPAFTSDTESKNIPYSLYTGPRFSDSQMEEFKTRALASAPSRTILENLGHGNAAIIPLQGMKGRYLHLKLLDNNSHSPDTTGRSHISGIYFAKADGEILSHSKYSLLNEVNMAFYGQDPPANMLNGNNERFWRSADSSKFPYSFTVDCKSSQNADYLIIARRAPTGWLPFFKNFEMELSNKRGPEKAIKLNANNFVTSKAAEEKLQGKPFVAICDAAGTISLRHYNGNKLGGKMSWTLWADKSQSYQAYIRLKNYNQSLSGKYQFNRKAGKITSNKFSHQLTTSQAQTYTLQLAASAADLENILAIDLVPMSQRKHYLSQISKPEVNILQPDLDRLHPDIVKKMEKVADGNYDIRTTVPQKIKKGQNGYVIITTEAKKVSLTSLDAFIRHKQSRGFNVQIITEKDYGGGTGQQASINIRQWLQDNYKKRKLLYALFLGNPHPKLGDTPYKLVGEKLWPTDYYFADLSGDWDKNKNGIYADEGDYGKGGINGKPDIYVGRIPFYGIDDAFGNAKHVDTMLERVIRYENQAGDLAWRHNIYYAGDTFERTQNFFYEYLSHNGAKLVRHTHSPNLQYGPDVDHYRQPETIKSQNNGKFGFVYYQEHGYPQGIGMMSTGGAEQLSDKNPAVYALGGCDVASPEHPDNVSFALLRNNGVAVYAGTRSVWSCRQHRWTKHTKYYPRLFFGMSTGETLWTTRADQSRDSVIGGTNFLINLLGDPSVVSMPQTTGETLSVSPGFDIQLSAIHGDLNLPTVSYEVQNNGPNTESYEIKHVNCLNVSPTRFSLRPGKFKTVEISVKSPEKLNTGEHKLAFKVSSKTQSKQLTLVANIQPRDQIYYNNFDSPITFVDNDKKKVDLTPEQTLTEGKFGAASKVSSYKSLIKTNHWGDRKSYTISYYQNIKKAANFDIIKTGPISIHLNGGKVKVWKRPAGYVYGPNPGAKTYDGPRYKAGQWQHVAIVYDRPNSKLTISVDGKSETHKLDYTDNIGFTSAQLEFPAKGDNEYSIDDLSIYNYPLNTRDLAIVAKQQFIAPTLPNENSKVNPSNVVLSWRNETSAPAKLEVSADPNFKRIVYSKKAAQGAKVSGLKNDMRYYWRVNHPSGRSFVTSNLVRSFQTDKTVQPMDFEVTEIKLPVAPIGVSGYNKRLNGFVSGLDREQAKGLTFSKVSGPEWLRIYPDGSLFTNYGPTPSDKGRNKFKVKITATDGTTEVVDFIVEAK